MGAVTDVLLPEVAVFRRADAKTRKLLFWILGATAVFSIGVCVAVFMILGHESKLARHGAQQFGAALVANSGSRRQPARPATSPACARISAR